ncbi:MAG: glycosyltransferase family 4 protein [Sumerlaeia bacterium]
MTVFLDARYLDGSYSGIGTYSRYLIEHLAKLDQTTKFQVLVRPQFRQALNVGDNFEFFTYKPKVVSYQTLFRLQVFLNELKPKIVHSLAPVSPIFYDGPLIVTLHDLQPFLDPHFHSKRSAFARTGYQLFYRWAYPTVLSKAKWIICDSYSTRDDALAYYPGLRPKLIVNHLGIDQQVVPPTAQEQNSVQERFGLLNSPYFLYYGSSRPNKNLVNLIKAYNRFLTIASSEWQNSKLVLVISKSRFFRDVQRQITRNKLEGKVIIIDPLESREHQALLAGAHALLFPTKYEGFGFPVLEAMQLGVPVLAGESGSLPEICGDKAVLVDPDDVDAITKSIHLIATNAGLRERLKVEGISQARLFDWDRTAQSMLDIYKLLF